MLYFLVDVFFLNMGDINVFDDEGFFVFYWVVCFDDVEGVMFLLDNGVDINILGMSGYIFFYVVVRYVIDFFVFR